MKAKKSDKGSKFPDLNKDGKITQADILQGRGVERKAKGGMCRGMGAAKRGGRYGKSG